MNMSSENRKILYAAIIVAVVIIAGVAIWMSQSDREQEDEDPGVSDMMLVMTVDGKRVDVDWEDNPSVDALKARAKDTLTVDMYRYGSFEQTGSMAKPIVRNDTSMEVGCGDIVLYNGIQICLYFDENSYSFTKLGKMAGMSASEIREMLDKPNVIAVFTLE